MIEHKVIEQQLGFTLDRTDFQGLGQKIEGKVRDSYVLGDRRILIATDRLSAFDQVLTTIPFKGQLLTEMAVFWFKLTKNILANHIIDQPHPNVVITQEVKILPVEVVIRGYLTGSAWRDYRAGKDISGIPLPQGLRKSQRFDTPLITPSTKAERGQHDLPISSEEIVSSGLVENKLWEEVCEKALALFNFGSEFAAKQGLILVDTKYEFGVSPSGELILADEIHTQDSSRYWLSSTYQDRFKNGEDPEMLDKEFVRRRLIERGYMGDGPLPNFEDSFRVETAIKYIESFEKITGTPFSPTTGDIKTAIKNSLAEFLNKKG